MQSHSVVVGAVSPLEKSLDAMVEEAGGLAGRPPEVLVPVRVVILVWVQTQALLRLGTDEKRLAVVSNFPNRCH